MLTPPGHRPRAPPDSAATPERRLCAPRIRIAQCCGVYRLPSYVAGWSGAAQAVAGFLVWPGSLVAPADRGCNLGILWMAPEARPMAGNAGNPRPGKGLGSIGAVRV